jgi:hypothetical protein
MIKTANFHRFTDAALEGYRSTDGRIEITDNGNGYGPARNSGRWAVMIDGQWISNLDYLAEAKAFAADCIRQEQG